MISQVLVFLKQCLNAYLDAKSDWSPGEPRDDKVEFINGEKMDPISFKLETVSVLLINVEQENTQRAADPYSRMSPDGSRQRIQPDIRLNLYVLFVARFKQYEKSLNYLSLIIQYFQTHRLLNQHNSPDLSEQIEQLSIELITLPFSEQNEIWNALRTTYHPSVLYRVKMVVFTDEDSQVTSEITEKNLLLDNKVL